MSYISTISGSELKNRIKPKLSMLEIELTELCNNNCVHCYIKNDKITEISTDNLKKIIDDAADAGCMKIKLTGGEPLLRADFLEIYSYIRRKGIKVILFTNGCLINNEHIEMFKKLPPEIIEVSVYGTKAETYEAVTRVKGSYEKMLNGIKLLGNNEIPLLLKFVTLDLNRCDMPDFLDWAEKTVPSATAQPPFEVMLNLTTDKNNEVNERIKAHRATPKQIVDSYFKSPNFADSTREFIKNFSKFSGDKLFCCSKYGKSIVVDSKGYAYGCNLLKGKEFSFDLKGGNIEDAIEFFEQIREKTSKNNEYVKRCGSCFLRSYCEMCPALSYIETGTLDTPIDYYCRISHIVGERLGLLKKDEKAWERR